MYVRASAADVNLSLLNAGTIFGGVTRLIRRDATADEFAFVTEKMPEKEISQKLKELTALGVQVQNTIRLGDF